MLTILLIIVVILLLTGGGFGLHRRGRRATQEPRTRSRRASPTGPAARQRSLSISWPRFCRKLPNAPASVAITVIA